MNETPITQLPDGSGCFTSTILSTEEAMKLPLKERPLNHRIPSEIYHAVFEAIGGASMCWNPTPSSEVFESEKAAKIATDLCFKIADAMEADPIRALVAAHQQLLDDGNNYAYFELAYTRQTGWSAWLCDRPAEGTPGEQGYGSNRKILAKGQGSTPDLACRAAVLTLNAERITRAPFSTQQQQKLEEWQKCDWGHALEHCDVPMTVHREGMHCAACDHLQTWVPTVCLQGPPPNPATLFEKQPPAGE